MWLFFHTRFEELPEFRVVLEELILGDRQFAAEEKVFQRVFVEDAKDANDTVLFLEIDAVVFDAVTVNAFAVAGNLAEFPVGDVLEILRHDLEAVNQFDLQRARHRRQFFRAHGTENNL